MNVKKYLAATFAAVCLNAARASAAVDSTAFVTMRTDSLSVVGYALAAVAAVVLAILGIKGLIFAYNRISKRLGNG